MSTGRRRMIRHPLTNLSYREFPGWHATSPFGDGNGLAHRSGMAIMWEVVIERPSLVPSPVELAWQRWLVEAMTATSEDAPASEQAGPEDAKPAA